MQTFSQKGDVYINATLAHFETCVHSQTHCASPAPPSPRSQPSSSSSSSSSSTSPSSSHFPVTRTDSYRVRAGRTPTHPHPPHVLTHVCMHARMHAYGVNAWILGAVYTLRTIPRRHELCLMQYVPSHLAGGEKNKTSQCSDTVGPYRRYEQIGGRRVSLHPQYNYTSATYGYIHQRGVRASRFCNIGLCFLFRKNRLR